MSLRSTRFHLTYIMVYNGSTAKGSKDNRKRPEQSQNTNHELLENSSNHSYSITVFLSFLQSCAPLAIVRPRIATRTRGKAGTHRLRLEDLLAEEDSLVEDDLAALGRSLPSWPWLAPYRWHCALSHQWLLWKQPNLSPSQLCKGGDK